MTFVRTVLGDIDAVRARCHVRPRAPRHRRRPAGRAGSRLPPRRRRPDDGASWRDAAAAGLAVGGRRDAGRLRPKSREARRAVAPDRRPHRRRDRPPPRAVLRPGALEPTSRRGRARRPVRRRHRGRHRRARLPGGRVVRRTERPGRRRQGRRQRGRPSARDLPLFAAAAAAHRRTGAPILTHCEAGTGAIEQVRAPHRCSASRLRHISLSHVDKVVDRGYHREIARRPAPSSTTTRSFRWGDADNGTLRLLEWVVEDSSLRSGRRSAWTPPGRATTGSYGGSPGLAWLLDDFSDAYARSAACDASIRQRLFVDNPARAFAFAEVDWMSHEELLDQRRRVARAPGLVRAPGSRPPQRGEFGPADLAEMLDDAVDLAIRDQEDGGDRRHQRRRDAAGRLLHRRVLLAT